jgi:uncharacterized DUF497 family protein
VFVWDEAKRKSNLEKHGLDFKDAYLVYENPDKCTYEAGYKGERRLMDIATAVVRGRRRCPRHLIPGRLTRGARTV